MSPYKITAHSNIEVMTKMEIEGLTNLYNKSNIENIWTVQENLLILGL